MKVNPEHIRQLRETHDVQKLKRVYEITDGIFRSHVGGTDALDALVWNSMPTPAEYDKFGYDPETDTATFYDMTARPYSRTAKPKEA